MIRLSDPKASCDMIQCSQWDYGMQEWGKLELFRIALHTTGGLVSLAFTRQKKDAHSKLRGNKKLSPHSYKGHQRCRHVTLTPQGPRVVQRSAGLVLTLPRIHFRAVLTPPCCEISTPLAPILAKELSSCSGSFELTMFLS